ncbi:MAG: hypothetical protein ACLQED_13640 [Desulfobaccales bacterium]|jgi:hypothetical protein
MKKLIIIALMIVIGAFQVPGAQAASAPQMIPFEMMPGSLGHATTLVPAASQFITNHSLTANTAKTITVPAGARWVNFSPRANLWVNFNGGTAMIPSADVLDGSGSYFNPPMFYIGPLYAGGVTTYPALATISVISDTTWVLTVMWYM